MMTTLTTISGIRVGHYTDPDNLTGCTVILCPPNTIGGVDQRGGAPGTRETDLLRPMHLIQHIHAVALAGGSAFGLRVADGVMDYLREQKVGFQTGSGVHVPIVPAAILYDLEIGNPTHPTAQHGYQAAQVADNAPVKMGNIGAGTGCSIGKLGGMGTATKAGIGSAGFELPNGLIVAALFAVNAVGDVLNSDGSILGGLRHPETGDFIGTLNMMGQAAATPPSHNTVIGVVATNAKLSKEATNKVAQMAHDGLARAVQPSHLLYDGDTIFSLATGIIDADVNLVDAYAAEATAAAIRAGVSASITTGGIRGIA